jgi:hypothetical protein
MQTSYTPRLHISTLKISPQSCTCNTMSILTFFFIFTTYHQYWQKSTFTYALRAPPPLAWPSSLVIITDATSTFSLKARAWKKPHTNKITLTTNKYTANACKNAKENGLIIHSFSHYHTHTHTHTHTICIHSVQNYLTNKSSLPHYKQPVTCDSQACPIEASITKMILSGCWKNNSKCLELLLVML